MKKNITLFLLLAVVIIMTGGCGGKADRVNNKSNTAVGSGNSSSIDDDTGNTLTGNEDKDKLGSKKKDVTAKFKAEVMMEGDFILVATNQTSMEYKGSDKVSVNLTDCLITDIGDAKITGKELKAGDIIEITYDGVMLDSYPAQIRASAVHVTGHNIMIDAYLAVIEDIWQEDTGLNNDINTIAVDTTGWIELNELQKETIFTKLKANYGFEIVEGTSDELEKQGLIDKDQLLFTNGVLITISDMKYDKQKKQLTYSVQKWRAGDGAVGSNDCTATWKDKEWRIERGSMWIS